VTFVTPRSLRGRLLLFLLVAILVTTGLLALVAYRTALAEADELFDYQMQQMAASLRPGLASTPSELDAAGHSEDAIEIVVQVWTSEGLQVYQSTARANLPQRAVLGFSTIEARGTTYRVFSVETRNQVVQIAQDLSARNRMAGRLALRTVVPIAFIAPLLMLVVWWVVTTSLLPVERVRRQVALRQAEALTEVNEQGLPDEIVPLVHELNLLFKRVGQAFDAQKSFVAAAAHELRSPLAALKLQVQGLHRAQNDLARERAVERLNAGIDRATRLVEQLLVLARQQATATQAVEQQPVPLGKVVQLVLADMSDAAHDRRVDVGVVRCDDCSVRGHEDALQILVRNLVDNAIKYTPQGGTVNLALIGTEDGVRLSVEDGGPGIPEEDQSRIFDRFYRVAGTQASGSGLGLAIVKTVADVHGAQLDIGRSASLGGFKITVIFPAC
jgi:two-component system OmpR family sensor kinase